MKKFILLILASNIVAYATAQTVSAVHDAANDILIGLQQSELGHIIQQVENGVQMAGTMIDMYNNAKNMLEQIEQNVKTADATFRSMEDQLKGMAHF